VATILLAGVDVFFRGKIEALLPEHHLVTADSIDPPDLVICDISRIEPEEVADTYPDVPILGFSNHPDTAGLRRANTAGFDQVLVKSSLDDRLKPTVEELVSQ
jgi:DNA-binding NarL/FixJ family response regulator